MNRRKLILSLSSAMAFSMGACAFHGKLSSDDKGGSIDACVSTPSHPCDTGDGVPSGESSPSNGDHSEAPTSLLWEVVPYDFRRLGDAIIASGVGCELWV